MGVGPALEHGQVGLAELAGQRAGRQQLMDQVLDAALVAGGLPGEPVTSPHATVQRRPGRVRQLEGMQPGRVDQRQPSQGVGVDTVGLGVARQHPPQVVGLGRADPVHDVAAAGEEHRDRQPRRAGRFHHHLQAGGWCHPGQGSLFHLGQALHGRGRLAATDQAAVTRKHPDGVGAGDRKGLSRPAVGRPSGCLLGRRGLLGGRSERAALGHGHGPKGAVSDDGTHSCAATGPDPAGSGHFPHPGHPWPAKGGNQTNEARRTSAFLRGGLNATPRTSRDAHATLGPGRGSSTAVPYMRTAVRRGATDRRRSDRAVTWWWGSSLACWRWPRRRDVMVAERRMRCLPIGTWFGVR